VLTARGDAHLPTPVSPSEPVHVLVVDDDRHVQRMLGDALTGAGFSVTMERDGESALKAFEGRAFDVVVLDVLLPLLNGYEVARRIKSTPAGAKVPVLMISGIYKSRLQAKEAVERHGAAAFVEKPFKLGALFDKLKGVLKERYPSPPPPQKPSPEPTRADPLADPRAEAEAAQVNSTAAPATSARGDFTEAPFAEVLANLHRQGATGALLLRREKVKKIIYFRQGVPVSVKSNRLSECLGRVMVREGMLSEADCENSLERMKASGRQQGTVLIEMGVISPHNLRYALDLQLRQKLMDVFSWISGEWQFNPAALPPPDTIRLELSPAAIIHEGVRRGFDEARLRARMGDVVDRVVWPTEDPLFAGQDMGLGEEELQMLARMDGSRTVAELRGLALLPPLDTDRLLYALLSAQMVELRSTRRDVLSTTPEAEVSKVEAVTEELGESDDGEEPLELEDEVPDDEDSALRERLLGTLAAMKRMDYFELLGVRSDASADEVRRAHRELVREYHLDKFVGSSSGEVRELARTVQELLANARDALVDASARADYRAKLGSGGVRHEVGEAVGRMLQAESTFRRGQQLLAAGDVVGARGLFSEAVQLQPEEGEFVAYLGWARFQASPDVPEEAQISHAALERAVQLSPTLEKAHLFLGYVLKALGRAEEATHAFEHALECNPSSAEALRELSILSWAVRLQKGTGKRPGL
jgi:DNA-binding response OmpR family regulator/tetratricopeptide (TPR) repeat protein